ncbi:MAG: ATP-binding protein [Saccharospirillum sp.]
MTLLPSLRRSSQRSFSLRRRLLVSASLVLLVFLSVTGTALDRAFEQSQMSGQSERLFLRILTLLAESEWQADGLWLPAYLAEERYNSPESGLVALVLDEQRTVIWQSLSSQWFDQSDWITAQPNISIGQEDFGFRGDYIYERYAVLWEATDGREQRYEFWVLETAAPLNQIIQTFRQQLWGGLVAVTLALLLALWLVARWGLRPLHQLAQNLQKIRTGEQGRLQGRYPRELQPLTDNLNRLLDAEQSQRERYRTAMADLAHSLKTPLAVIRTLEPADSRELHEQVHRMDQIVRYQLQRAVTETRQGPVLGQRCSLNQSLDRLGRALGKAFHHEDKVLDLPEPDQEWTLAMDVNDVLEVFGNLLENGFKYARSVITVSVSRLAEFPDCWVVDIDDDGPGITLEQRHAVLNRGQRLDTLQPGQGIGLSMVTDILGSYGVALRIDDSPLGGARFRLVLPEAP